MNRKGQTLIVFVVMIPLILILAAFVIDIGIVLNAKTKMDSTITMILKEYYSKREMDGLQEDIQEVFQKNHFNPEILEVTGTHSYLNIKVEDSVDSIFGKLIGMQEYRYTSSKTIRWIENQYQITKE